MASFTCVICKISKPVSEFRKTGAKRGHSLNCKECWASYMREYYASKPEKYNKHKGYVKINDETYKAVRFKYNLSQDQFDTLLSKHNGLCWSCKESPANCIDHDHSCCPGVKTCGDCIRGMLCNGCNSALGHLKDSVSRINSLASYLTSTR